MIKSGDSFWIRREQWHDIGRCEDVCERNFCADSESQSLGKKYESIIPGGALAMPPREP
jgi:hypothetical protein